MSQYGMGRGAMLSKMVNNYTLVGAEKKNDSSQQLNSGVPLITPNQLLALMGKSGNKSNNSECIVNSEDKSEFIVENDKDKRELLNAAPISSVSSPIRKTGNQEDIDWQIYKFTRKIKEILKNVHDENFGVIYQELKDILEEFEYQWFGLDRPLSSRFTDTSEAQQCLDVLVNKATQDDKFLPYVPSLIKLVHSHTQVEFKKYFAELIDAKRKEVIQVCASEDTVLSGVACNFCKMLAQLIAMPRPTGTKLYDIICPLVEDCVERWTLPEGTDTTFEGHSLSLAAVKAEAVCVLLKEISSQTILCDRVIEQKMETFVWYLRETVLNANVTRKLREIYLDGLIGVQITTGKPERDVSYYVSLPEHTDVPDEQDRNYVHEHVPVKINSPAEVQEGEDEEEEENGEDDVVIESEENIGEDYYEPELKIEERKVNDPYFVVKYVLKTLDVEDLVPVFVEHEIQDVTLKTLDPPSVMSTLKKTNISRMVMFSIDALIKNKGFDNLRLEALNTRSSNDANSAEVSNDEKITSSAERPKSRNSFSERMAINFKKVPSSTPKHEEQKSKVPPCDVPADDSNVENIVSVDGEANTDNSLYVTALQDMEENSEDSEDDEVEIEEQYEVCEQNQHVTSVNNVQSTVVQNSLIATSVKTEQPKGVSSASDTGSSISNNKFPSGRGRGMIRLPNFDKIYERSDSPGVQRNDIPIAKISPSGRENNTFQSSVDRRNYQNSQRRGSPRQHQQQQQTQQQQNFSRQSRQHQQQHQNNYSRHNRQQQQHQRSSFQQGDSRASRDKNWRQNSGNRNNTNSKLRFQPIYQPKDEGSTTIELEAGRMPEFGASLPKMCFNCSSTDHVTEDCMVINPFFN